MTLEFHDNETGNTLCAVARNLDYDYQAEQHVQETSREQPYLVKWILSDDLEIRCVWERPEGNADFPNITQRSTRFQGEWEKGPVEVSI